jgi:hypothetical protein
VIRTSEEMRVGEKGSEETRGGDRIPCRCYKPFSLRIQGQCSITENQVPPLSPPEPRYVRRFVSMINSSAKADRGRG